MEIETSQGDVFVKCLVSTSIHCFCDSIAKWMANVCFCLQHDHSFPSFADLWW